MGEIADALRRAREARSVDEPGAHSHPEEIAAPPAPSIPRSPAQPSRADWDVPVPGADGAGSDAGGESDLVQLDPSDHSLLVAETPALEASRRLAVRVRDAMDRRKLRSLAVVSSTRGEGKTTLACNLALALASLSAGREVALVDLDLRRPSLARVFSLSPRIGIEQILRGAACLEESRIGIERPPVDLYPVSELQRAAHELLVTPTFSEVLRQLEDRYDVVLFDTAPTLAVPDVSLMLRHVGACIPVARIGVTRTRHLKQLLDVLPRNKTLGPVLNGAKLAPDTAYYYAGDEPKPARVGRGRSWQRRGKRGSRGNEA